MVDNLARLYPIGRREKLTRSEKIRKALLELTSHWLGNGPIGWMNWINHGHALLKGQMSRDRWISALVTYCIPYLVNVHGQCMSDVRQKE